MTTQVLSARPGFAGRTDAGLEREQNEDRYLAVPPLFVVADGLGGHQAGEIAAEVAIATLAELGTGSHDPRSLVDAIERANDAILRIADEDRALRGMGTTCVALLFDDAHVHVAHVGDSRAYRLRRGTLDRLTEDDTVVAAMVRDGLLARDDADRDDRRNVLTQALGVGGRISVATASHPIEPGDRYLLCSDGLSGQLSDSEIQTVLVTDGDPGAAADDLIELANQKGGVDNVTVVVIDADLVARPSSLPPVLQSSPLRQSPTGRQIGPAVGIILALLVVAAIIAWQFARPAESPTVLPTPLPSLATPSGEASDPKPLPPFLVAP